jgi:UDP-N-acetylglucosamine transferase subunit ALG13
MIFVTVGVQLPFDRLIRAVDDWAGRRQRRDVVAQIGASRYVARSIETHAFLSPASFRSMVERADLIVGHAGMGSIITAFELQKPIIVLPRLASLGEHRNDHQLATARRMAAHANVSVADDAQGLARMLDEFRAAGAAASIASHASEKLIAEIQGFIRQAQAPAEGTTSAPRWSPRVIQGR